MALRYGLIGCGAIGQLRAQALARLGNPLTAASDLSTDAAAATKAAAVEKDWRKLIQRADVDAVIVSTPPSVHADMTIEALRAGKHVLCEKPLARTPEEGRAMLDAARQSGRFLATGFNYRFYPSALKARELLDSGLIGELDHIRSYTGYSATEHHQAWLHDATIMGGGSLRDNGIHLLDLTCYFLGGDVGEIKGMASGRVWEFPGCEDNGFALLRNSRGNIASVQASWTEWRGYRFGIEIVGSRGMIRLSCFPMVTEAVWAAERSGKTQRKTWYFPKVFFMEHLRSYRWVVVESFLHEFTEFEKAVAGQPSRVATGQDGQLTLEIAATAGKAVGEMAAPAR